MAERRQTSAGVSGLEIRSKDDGTSTLEGYAAVYYDGTEATEFRFQTRAGTEIVERIRAGAFAELDGDIVATVNHDESRLLGRTPRTLRLSTDDRGLRFEVDLPDTTDARDLAELVRRGDIRGCSFGFIVRDGGQEWRSEGTTRIRELSALEVVEVGPVTSPAYTGTEVGVRSAGDAETLERELATAERAARTLPERRWSAARRESGLWEILPAHLERVLADEPPGAFEACGVACDRLPHAEARPGDLFDRLEGGIALISVRGEMVKIGWLSEYWAATPVLSRAVKAAAADESISGILLVFDSPGGSVAGTHELAETVYAARQAKPVAAHAESTLASAAYKVASQAGRISVGPDTTVGSIGTLAVVYDTSAAAADAGVTVHAIASGPRKGDFVPGTPISDEALAKLREEVDERRGLFVDLVARGRGRDPDDVRSWATGETWLGRAAVELGLVDAEWPIERAYESLRGEAIAATLSE